MSGRAVILVAGGTGTRMQSKIAKQFLLLNDRPVLIHTFEAFHRFDPKIHFVLVLFRGLENQWSDLVGKYNFDIPHQVVEGGAERFHSVKNGIDALPENIQWVGIHDAVRPLVSSETISRCFAEAEKSGAAIPVVPVTDTIRQTSNKTSKTLVRDELVAVQTPQCFSHDLIQKSYEVPFSQKFTDDASVVEHSGHAISLVEGNRTNIKITTSEDLIVARAFLHGNP